MGSKAEYEARKLQRKQEKLRMENRAERDARMEKQALELLEALHNFVTGKSYLSVLPGNSVGAFTISVINPEK